MKRALWEVLAARTGMGRMTGWDRSLHPSHLQTVHAVPWSDTSLSLVPPSCWKTPCYIAVPCVL